MRSMFAFSFWYYKEALTIQFSMLILVSSPRSEVFLAVGRDSPAAFVGVDFNSITPRAEFHGGWARQIAPPTAYIHVDFNLLGLH